MYGLPFLSVSSLMTLIRRIFLFIAILLKNVAAVSYSTTVFKFLPTVTTVPSPLKQVCMILFTLARRASVSYMASNCDNACEIFDVVAFDGAGLGAGGTGTEPELGTEPASPVTSRASSGICSCFVYFATSDLVVLMILSQVGADVPSQYLSKIFQKKQEYIPPASDPSVKSAQPDVYSILLLVAITLPRAFTKRRR